MTSSTLVKCVSMIVSLVMPSYPNVTLLLWYLISQPKPDNTKHNPKNILILLFNTRVCSQSTLIGL